MRGFAAGVLAAACCAGACASAPTPSPPPLAGQWRGALTVGDERTAELVVDLVQVAGRWTGQFDLHDFGVEDYPVEVAFAGRTVTLHLSAAQLDFEGELSAAGDVLSGIARSQGHADSLRLARVGEPQLTEEFLRLEVMAEDSAAVEALSANARELSARFNADRAYTRLVMLLSPT